MIITKSKLLFSSFFLILFISNTIFASFSIKQISLSDSIHSDKNKNIFNPGEKIYVLYTIQGLNKNSEGFIWLDVDVSISDVNGNVLYKNIVDHSVKNKHIKKNRFNNHLIIDLPNYISNKLFFITLDFKDQIAHKSLSKKTKIEIVPSSFKIVNIRYTNIKNLSVELPEYFFPGKKVNLNFNITGLKIKNNSISLKYGVEIRNSTGDILHPLKNYITLEKTLGNDEPPVVSGNFQFTTGLPGKYIIVVHAWDKISGDQIATRKSYQVLENQMISSKTPKNEEKKITNNNSTEIKSYETTPISPVAEKPKEIPEQKIKRNAALKPIIDVSAESSANGIKFFNEKTGLFSFKFYDNWKTKENSANNDYIFLKSPDNQAYISIHMTITYQDTLEQILEKRTQIIRNLFPSILEISKQSKTFIAGHEAYKFNYKGFAFTNKPSKGELTIIYNPEKNYALYVLLVSNPVNFELYRNSYNLIINSFKITNNKENKESMNNIIGTWEHENSLKKQSSRIVSFYNNGRFKQNRDKFFYNIPRTEFDYVWEAYNNANDPLDNNGKYKIVGETLYLFYDNGTYAEFSLSLGNGHYIILDQKHFNRVKTSTE